MNIKQGSCVYQLLQSSAWQSNPDIDYEADALTTRLCAGCILYILW